MFAEEQAIRTRIVIAPHIRHGVHIGDVFDRLVSAGIRCEIFGVYSPNIGLCTQGMLRLEIFPPNSSETAEHIDYILRDIPDEHITIINGK